MSYVFGPVPSRRLGRSLGVDTVPLKTCNWNCVYCQLGRTTPIVTARRPYLPARAILEELRAVLDSPADDDIDWITFVASGEGTLHSEIGLLIREVGRLSRHPVAVITNGSLLYRDRVRDELSAADAVLPTLDAGSERLYARINRPHPRLSLAQHVAGLIAFARHYRGRLWLEVMLVGGLNDTEPALRDLAGVIARIAPHEVHLTTPTRAPAESWVRPPDADGLMRAQAILGGLTRLVPPTGAATDLGRYSTPEHAIEAVVARHPMRLPELETLLESWPPQRVRQAVRSLEAARTIRPVRRLGCTFYTGSGSRHATAHEPPPHRTSPAPSADDA